MTPRFRLAVAGLICAFALAAVGFTVRERTLIHQWWSGSAPVKVRMGSAAPAASQADTPRADVTLDARRRQLIGVRTVMVRRAPTGSTIRTVGVVRASETRLTEVNVRVAGWIRDLLVDYTGQPVTKGQPMLSLYSPDLLAAQREYVLAIKGRTQLRSSMMPDSTQRNESLIASARQRLQVLDFPADQLGHLEQTLEPESTMIVHAPTTGVVVEKTAVAGMHVTSGQTLYRLADLGVVWVDADAYEHDLPAIRIGAVGRVTLDAYPTEPLNARVVFIDPSLQPETRTAKVRFEVPNPNGRLKPGMYATVDISTASLPALIVPADAVLDSGREQIVFVAKGNGDFSPRQVQVGVRRADTVEIVSGLKEGDEVASGAAFFLDSESQLRAAVSGYESQQPSAPSAGPTQPHLAIALRSQPDPPKIGENTFEVSVKDAAGRAVSDAQVAVQFFMPAMPAMNMPAMRNTVPLSRAGDGLYRGTGEIMMAGRWEVTVTVTRQGQSAGTLQTTLVTK